MYNDTIMQAVSNNAGRLYFRDAPGGTDKCGIER